LDQVVGMEQRTLEDILESFVNSQSIFKNKKALSINYYPDRICFRDNEIQNLVRILGPVLKNEKPSNVFIYGGTGTGKTLVTKYVTNQIKKTAEKYNFPIQILYVNCKMKKVSDTEYRLLAYLCELMGLHVPATGLPTDEVYRRFFNRLSYFNGPTILILDEIDALVRKIGDELLYNLTRCGDEGYDLTIVGISNDLSFTQYLDARVKSSLSEEEMIFPPYNAEQLFEILKDRAKIAFNEGKIDECVIRKCAALAAQEHGDARRALDLLRVAGEIAERNNDSKVEEIHVDLAEEKLDLDRMSEAARTLPKHSKLVLYTILKLLKNKEKVLTGEVQKHYEYLCKQISLRPLTQRRISDIISELDMLGLVNALVISKGRYGRTREISLSVTEDIQNKVLSILHSELFL